MRNVKARLQKVEETIMVSGVAAYDELTSALADLWMWVQLNCTPEQSLAFDMWVRGETLPPDELAIFETINPPKAVEAQVKTAGLRMARFPMRMLLAIQERSEAQINAQLASLACSDPDAAIRAEARDLLA